MYDEDVTVRYLRVVDSEGRERACLGAEESVVLSLFDADGNVRLRIHQDLDGDAGVRIFDFAERCLLAVVIGKDGPRIDMRDETARLRASVQLSPDGDVVLILADRDGKGGDDALILGTSDALAKVRKPPDGEEAT